LHGKGDEVVVRVGVAGSVLATDVVVVGGAVLQAGDSGRLGRAAGAGESSVIALYATPAVVE